MCLIQELQGLFVYFYDHKIRKQALHVLGQKWKWTQTEMFHPDRIMFKGMSLQLFCFFLLGNTF